MFNPLDSLRVAQALDPVVFARLSLGFEADPWQARLLRSPAKRMLVNCSRQSGKSTCSAIKALHRAVYYPKSLVLVISPSLRQSGELFRKVLDLRHMIKLPDDKEESRTAMMLYNGSRILSLPGAEDTVRGFSAVTLAIEDEAAQCEDNLYRAIRPMLAVSKGSLMLLSTPRGKRGHFYHEWTDGGDEWDRYEVKATDCPRIAPEFLESEKQSLGDRWFRQEYMTTFEDMEDQVFSFDAVDAAFGDDVKPMFDEGDIVDVDVSPVFEVMEDEEKSLVIVEQRP
jgi:hypothetical protein